MAACAPVMKERRSKLKAWLKTKFNAFVTHKNHGEKFEAGHHQRPLTNAYLAAHSTASTSNARRQNKQLQAAPPTVPASQQQIEDDCSQPRTSSDQTLAGEVTTVARQDEHQQSRLPSARASHVGFPPEAGQAAAHMAALRDLLVTHISQATAATNRQGQHSHRQMRPHQTAGLPAGHAVAADHMQLLDLVEVLINDHRTSLLERKRLQQQLDSVQQALLTERLDKERAAALADMREAEVHRAQEDLACTVAVVERLQQKRTITSMQIQLPPSASSTGSSRRSSTAEQPGTQGSFAAPDCEDSIADTDNESEQHSSRRNKQASAVAAASRKQGAGVIRDLSKAPAASAHAADRSSRHSSSQRSAASSTPSKVASCKAGAGSTAAVARDPRAAALSLRPGARAAAAARGAAAVKAAAAGTPGKAARRLLGTGTERVAADGRASEQHLKSQSYASATDQRQQKADSSKQGSRKGHTHTAAGAAAAAAVSRAPAGVGGACAEAMPQLQATSPGDLTGQDSQLGSCNTLASCLSVSAGPDAMLGVTKQQLHKALQRPWLQEASQASLDDAGAAAGPGPAADGGCATRAASETEASVGSAWAQQGSAIGAGELSYEDEHPAAEHSEVDDHSLMAVIESTGSRNGSTYSSQPNPRATLHTADGKSSIPPSGAAGDTGSSTDTQARPRGRQQMAAVCSSNGSSWPGIKASEAAAAPAVAGPDGTAALPAAKPSPMQMKHASIRLRGRSRVQPQHLSTSLESATTLPLQGPAAVERSSQGSSVADATLLEGTAATAWACGSLDMVQEEQQQADTELARATPSSSNPPSDNSAGSLGIGQHSSGTSIGPGASAVAALQPDVQQPKQRRRWAAPSPQPLEAQPTADGHMQPGQQSSQQQHGDERVACMQDEHASLPPPAAAAAAEHQALSKKHLQALAADGSMCSSGELSAATSDLACMSIASAATGCTTLSGLAGVYLQHPSKPTKVCPRPSFVPKLHLQGISNEQAASDADQPHGHKEQQKQQSKAGAQTQLEQQAQVQMPHMQQQKQQSQQQQQSKQHTPRAEQQEQGVPEQLVRPASTASQQEQRQQQVTPCSSTGRHLGSARSYLTAEELAEMAPLMAHPTSSRARRHSATGGAAATSAESADAAASNAAGAAAGARCTPRASRSSNGSIISNPSSNGAAAAAAAPCTSHSSQQAHTARGMGGGVLHTAQLLGRTAPGVAGEASSSGVNRSQGGLSTRGYRPSSGGGSNTGLTGGVGYWGSSAGSYPASENPSRQPTPRVSDPTGAGNNNAAAGGGGSSSGGGGQAVSRTAARSRPSTAGNTAAMVDVAGNVPTGTAPQGSSAAAAASAASGAAGAMPAAAGTAPVGVTSHGVVLTAIPPPCAASATAAAAGSFMTMRPAHLYRSVSTVYAMYSPLMGNLRALGHSRAGSGAYAGSAGGHPPHTAGAHADSTAAHQLPTAGVASGDGMRPEVPTFAGLAASMTTTMLEPHQGLGPVPEADVAAAVAAAAAAHECHWQTLLLGGCPPVPEEGTMQWAAAQQAPAAGAAHGAQTAASAAAAGCAGQDSQPCAGRINTPRHAAQGSSETAAQQQPAAGALPPTAAPPAAEQQLLPPAQPQQSGPTRLQVEVPTFIDRDVVERGPVLPPGGPMAISPHRPRLSSPTRQLSPLAAAAAAAVVAREAGDAGLPSASSPLLAAAEAGAPVGPLTACSPTRLQWHRGHSSHSQQQHSSRPAAGPHRQQQQQPRQQQSQLPPRQPSRLVSPGRAAAIEAAAASVAAHVAAAAQLINRQEQRLSNSQLLMQPEQPAAAQQQQQHGGSAEQQNQQTLQAATPLRRQQSQGVQVELDELMPAQQGMQPPPHQRQQQQHSSAPEPECSLCCFSPMSADAGGGWINEASPSALVAAASATVDTLMQQAELYGRQYVSHRTHQQQHQPPAGVSSSSNDGRLHGTSSSDMGLLSPSNTQQQQQRLMHSPAARPPRTLRAQRTPGGHQKRRTRSRWHIPQQQQQDLPHSQPLDESDAQLHLQLQRTPPRSSRSTSRSRHQQQHAGSVAKLGSYRTVRTPPMSPGAAAALEPLEEMLVRTYQNPLLALEAAGLPDLGTSIETELVSAALMPALVGQLAQQASDASSFGGGSCGVVHGLAGCGAGSCEAAAGVSAAAVPVHMTPLAKERSVRVLGATQGLSREGSGAAAGGQLHWNPLYNPSRADGSVIMSESLQ